MTIRMNAALVTLSMIMMTLFGTAEALTDIPTEDGDVADLDCMDAPSETDAERTLPVVDVNATSVPSDCIAPGADPETKFCVGVTNNCPGALVCAGVTNNCRAAAQCIGVTNNCNWNK